MNERLKSLFSDSLGYLAVAIVSLIYILSGFFVPGLTGKSIYTIIAEGAMNFILGVSMNGNLTLQGVLKGKRSEELRATRQSHADAVQDIAGEIDGLDLWCEERNAQKLREHRTQLLVVVGLHYEDFFDESGNAVGNKQVLSREQRRALRKARRAKITQLSTASLTCDGEDAEDPFNFGETPSQYQRRTSLKDAVSKLITATIFGYFGADAVENFDLATLAWRALFVAILLALGVAKLVNAYLFVTDTYRGNIVKKINYLQAYKNCAREYARRAREDAKNVEHDTVHVGSIQNGRAEAACAAAPSHKAVGGYQLPKVDEIPAAADEGIQHRYDGNGQDRREQRPATPARAGGYGLLRQNAGAEQLPAHRAGAIGRQGVSAPVERGREGV